MPHNRKLTKEKRVKKKHQFVLILGIINVILPVIPVLSHRGWFGMVKNNTYEDKIFVIKCKVIMSSKEA